MKLIKLELILEPKRSRKPKTFWKLFSMIRKMP